MIVAGIYVRKSTDDSDRNDEARSTVEGDRAAPGRKVPRA